MEDESASTEEEARVKSRTWRAARASWRTVCLPSRLIFTPSPMPITNRRVVGRVCFHPSVFPERPYPSRISRLFLFCDVKWTWVWMMRNAGKSQPTDSSPLNNLENNHRMLLLFHDCHSDEWAEMDHHIASLWIKVQSLSDRHNSWNCRGHGRIPNWPSIYRKD